ncbi:MAG: hypothetical protein MZV64_34790 [Ignavibacteriales bacterium]|nr:hypothetical protein [Ignavibacteriales bacterium]
MILNGAVVALLWGLLWRGQHQRVEMLQVVARPQGRAGFLPAAPRRPARWACRPQAHPRTGRAHAGGPRTELRRAGET